jgi:predicted component of type VI protein secretion system
MVPVVGDEGSSSVCSKGPSQLAASFSFDTSIRTDRRMAVNFATRKERRWRFRVVAMVGRRSCVVRSEQYRRYAQACLLLARNAEDEQARASLLHMAQVWFRLAEECVNETVERQSAES